VPQAIASGHVHEIVVLALDGVVAFDLSTPVEVFGRARLLDGRPAYRVRVCSLGEQVDAGPFRLRTAWVWKRFTPPTP
jgi:hypothetical protein